MEPRELSAEELLRIAGEPGTPVIVAGLTANMFAVNPELMAGMMLAIQDAVLGTCPCDTCTAIRNMTPTADQFLNNMAGGDIG